MLQRMMSLVGSSFLVPLMYGWLVVADGVMVGLAGLVGLVGLAGL